MQWVSSGLGGFITGRLRTKWVGTHTHEVFFRDTAHGFLTWAVASVIGALLLASAASSAIGTGTQPAATAASGAAQGVGSAAQLAQTHDYDLDTLFRGEKPDMAASDPAVRGETTRILVMGLRNGNVPAADRSYLAQLVADRTGVSQADAQKRVDDAVAAEKAAETKARQAADAARKSASAVAIFTALSMVIGAFIASVAAAFGGSLRDEHV